MDFEFHYYITGIIAHEAGFSEEEVSTIAFASQFVDDNTVVYHIKDKNTDNIYSNYISQTIDILNPRETLMRIYSVFHFVPGDPMAVSARRKDGKMHLLNTIPDSKLSQNILNSAFHSPVEKRLYRIGIASHVYADTWAHQNFIGFNDSFNGFSLNPIPNIGHSDAILDPDRVNRIWNDERLLKSEVDNNDRFISAAEMLFYKFTDFLNTEVEWEPIKKILLAIMEIDNQKKRINLYSTLVPWLLPYDKRYWFDSAINQKVRGLKDSRNEVFLKLIILKDKYYWKKDIEKEDTDWFKFQEAIKDHQAEVLPLVNNVCKLMGMDIKLF